MRSRTDRARRWWVRVVLSIALLEIAYVVVATIALQIARAVPPVDFESNGLTADYSFAWSPWPFYVIAHGVRVWGEDSRVQWYAEGDRAEASLDLLALKEKRLRIRHGRALGVTIRVRGQHEPEDLCGSKGQVLPPLPDHFPNSGAPGCLQAQADSLRRRRAGAPPPPDQMWKIEIEEAEAPLREVWIEGQRFMGEIHGAVALYFWPTQSLRIDHARLDLLGVKLDVGDIHGLSDLHGSFDASMGLLSLAGRPMEEPLRHLDGSAEFTATVTDLRLLNGPPTGEPKKAEFVRGEGALRGHLTLERGRPVEGTELILEAKDAAADLPFGRGLGALSLEYIATGEGQDAEAQLRVVARDFELRRSKDSGPFARGPKLEIDLSGPRPSLIDPWKPSLDEIVISKAHLPDLALLDRGLPREVRLLSGSAVLDGRVPGEVAVEARGLRAKYKQMEVEANLTAKAILKATDLQKGIFNVAGSRLVLDDVRVDRGETSDAWWAQIDLVQGTGVISEDPRIKAKLESEMRDLRPLLALAGQAKGVPKWIRGLLAYEGVRGACKLEARRDHMFIDQLNIHAGQLDVLARYRADKSDKKGGILLRLGGLQLGLKIDNDETSAEILHPAEPYEKMNPSFTGS